MMLKEDLLTAITDKQEKNPLDLFPLKSEPGTLTTGDYSIKGLAHVIAVERKSLGDLLSCCGVDRPRFQRQMDRLASRPIRMLVIESTWAELEAGEWKSQIKAQSVIGTLLGIQAMGIPVSLVGTHERAGRHVARFLFIAARRRFREVEPWVRAIHETANLEKVV